MISQDYWSRLLHSGNETQEVWKITIEIGGSVNKGILALCNRADLS